jgi:hypothetical protein
MREDQLLACAGQPYEAVKRGSANEYRYGYVHRMSSASSWCVLTVTVENGVVSKFTTNSGNPGGLTDGSSSCGFVIDRCVSDGLLRASVPFGTVERMRGDDDAVAGQRHGREGADRAMSDIAGVVGAQNTNRSASGSPAETSDRSSPGNPTAPMAPAPRGSASPPTTAPPSNDSPAGFTPGGPSSPRGSGGGSCAPYQQGLDACRRAVSGSTGASACAPMEDALRKCQSEQRAETPRPAPAPPMRLEREICDAMTLKCGQDSGSSDCRAFQDSVRNNGYRCAAPAPDTRTAQPNANWGQCVAASTSGTAGTEPALTLTNNCPGMITWRHCVRVSGRSFTDTPSGITQAGSSSVYRLRLAKGETFDWRHSWCAGQCTPSTPRC